MRESLTLFKGQGEVNQHGWLSIMKRFVLLILLLGSFNSARAQNPLLNTASVVAGPVFALIAAARYFVEHPVLGAYAQTLTGKFVANPENAPRGPNGFLTRFLVRLAIDLTTGMGSRTMLSSLWPVAYFVSSLSLISTFSHYSAFSHWALAFATIETFFYYVHWQMKSPNSTGAVQVSLSEKNHDAEKVGEIAQNSVWSLLRLGSLIYFIPDLHGKSFSYSFLLQVALLGSQDWLSFWKNELLSSYGLNREILAALLLAGGSQHSRWPGTTRNVLGDMTYALQLSSVFSLLPLGILGYEYAYACYKKMVEAPKESKASEHFPREEQSLWVVLYNKVTSLLLERPYDHQLLYAKHLLDEGEIAPAKEVLDHFDHYPRSLNDESESDAEGDW